MKRMLILINGEAGAGKDTFAFMCYNKLMMKNKSAENLHRSDISKKLLKELGWNGKKTRSVRRLLADMTDFGERTGENNRQLFATIENGWADVVFYHSRSTEAMKEIKEHYIFNSSIIVKTMLIKRDNIDTAIEKEEDRWGIDDFNYDYVIENNGSMEELNEKSRAFVDKIAEVLKW